MRELALRFYHCAIVAAVALAGIAIACVCHSRIRRLRRRELLSRKVEDALVQNAQGLILKVHGIVKELPAGDPTRQRMESALDRADEALSSDRDRVQHLRTHAMLDRTGALEDSVATTSASSAKLTAWMRRLLHRVTFKRPQ